MAAWESLSFSNSELTDLILGTLDLEEYIDLGETGRTFTSKAFGESHEVPERAEFQTWDLIKYDTAIELDDDTLDLLCREAITSYVREHRDEWRTRIQAVAEAFKTELLSGPAGS